MPVPVYLLQYCNTQYSEWVHCVRCTRVRTRVPVACYCNTDNAIYLAILEYSSPRVPVHVYVHVCINTGIDSYCNIAKYMYIEFDTGMLANDKANYQANKQASTSIQCTGSIRNETNTTHSSSHLHKQSYIHEFEAGT